MQFKTFIIIILAIISGYILSGCSDNEPVTPEGNTKLTIYVFSKDADSSFQISNAEVKLLSEYSEIVGYTDTEGKVEFNDIPVSTYQIRAQSNHPDNAAIVLTGDLSDVSVSSGSDVIDTVWTSPTSGSGIIINEIFYAGSKNNIFYSSDQFIELYNSSNEVKYLDGLMILRLSNSTSSNNQPGSDYDGDGDIDGVLHAYKFPGNPGDNNIKLLPSSFIILVTDAFDHTQFVESSYDFSNADFEFYNQFSEEDTDNPNVINLINMRSDTQLDFNIRLDNDIVAISAGIDTVWNDGIKTSEILDLVEYQVSTSSKTSDLNLDRSFVVSPPKYSGKSVSRISDGYDTNNSAVDFEITEPTPGY